MQAAAVLRTAKQCSGNEALQGWCAALAGMSEMQLRAKAGCCHASNRLRMRAVAGIAKAWLRKRSPSRRSAALCAEQYAAGCECRLAAARATDRGCGLVP